MPFPCQPWANPTQWPSNNNNNNSSSNAVIPSKNPPLQRHHFQKTKRPACQPPAYPRTSSSVDQYHHLLTPPLNSSNHCSTWCDVIRGDCFTSLFGISLQNQFKNATDVMARTLAFFAWNKNITIRRYHGYVGRIFSSHFFLDVIIGTFRCRGMDNGHSRMFFVRLNPTYSF